MKRTISRKVLFLMLTLFTAFAIQAQEKGDMAAGLNLSYGTKSGYSNFGVGAKFQYSFTDALRIEPSATYFFKKDYVSMWDINVNLHYLFHVADKFAFYPLAGVSLLGANLGAGAQYWLTDNFALAFEIKYQLVSDYDRPVFTLGAAYKF